MSKRIVVEVDGTTATYALRDDLAPKSATALWENLPIQGTVRHGKLSGDACFTQVHEGPLTQLAETPELAVTSIYKGFLVVAPAPAHHSAELLLSYGQAEYRWPTGRRYVTPLAEAEGDASSLFERLRRMHAEGETSISIRRADG